MTPRVRQVLVAAAIVATPAAAALLHGQAREWTTANGDAQRNAWVRAVDPRLTKDAIQKGELKFLWKLKLNGETRQLNALTQPILLDRLISHRGFKALAFVGTSNERIFAIDTDLSRIYWEHVINYSSIAPPANSSWSCPGGLTAAFTRPTIAAPPAFGAGRGGGGRSGSSVGEPGRGAPSLQLSGQGRGRANDPAPPAAGRGTAPAAAAAPQGGRGAPSPGNGGGPTENVFVLASDGLLRTLNTHNGSERFPATPFLPANARAAGLILVDGVLYTTTSNGCGAVPDGVYAMDLNVDVPKTMSWRSGASVAGTAGVAVGTDRVIFAATAATAGAPAVSGNGASYASSVVALDPKTLELKDWFSAPGADFNATPVVIRHNNRDLVVITANDGRMYLLDGTSLGGSDHKTALHVTAKYTAAGVTAGVASWEDQGTRWILAPTAGAPPPGLKAASNGPAPNGGIVAFKLVEQGGKTTLEPAWASRDMTSPLTPVVFSGVVFAVSSGEHRAAADARLSPAQRAKASIPAVLYALDPATGKELWNSGKSITSFARAGLAAAAGQVYVVTYDNTLYAFGVPMEH